MEPCRGALTSPPVESTLAGVRLRTLLEIYAGSPELIRHAEVVVL